MTYLIWSQEHGAWWKPAASGYTRSITSAGRYSKDQAERICQTANQFLPEGFHELALPDPLQLPATQTFYPTSALPSP